jgi:phosphatidylserine/phosphatidylglycerophosphate/cardiolipin synthase-like enzyme
MIRLISFMLLLFPVVASSIQADVSVCFTPGDRCDKRIINAIDDAQRTIDVQAYQLTSAPIKTSLDKAHRRGVKVITILDKSQSKNAAVYFVDHNIPVWIDRKVSIAHNKVMIIDGSIVITGSYNFSHAAQYRNAENVVFIKSKDIASEYLKNFDRRIKVSEKLN